MNRWVVAGVFVAVAMGFAVGALVSVGGAATDAGPEPAAITAAEGDNGQPEMAVRTADQQFDRSSFEIVVHENGSATWTFRHERSLASDEVESFESFADTFESTETDLYDRFQQQANSLLEAGQERTDREMAVTAFNRSAGVERHLSEQGVVEMTFRWDGFATVDEEGTVVVGDVFNGLPLESDQQLIIHADEGLTFVSAQPEGEYTSASLSNANSITWVGDQVFIEGQPRVILEQQGAGEGDSRFSLGWPTAFGVLIALVLASTAAFALYRRGGRRENRVSLPLRGSEGTSPGPPVQDEPSPAEDLRSDDDRVVALLEDHGGRMRQVAIVEETGWSKSKVSMLLSEMEADGQISKLRVGRENIVSLDGYEPEAAKSPFEE